MIIINQILYFSFLYYTLNLITVFLELKFYDSILDFLNITKVL